MHDDGVGLQLVELLDDAVHQVRHEERRTDVRIGDVGDRDHGASSLAARLWRATLPASGSSSAAGPVPVLKPGAHPAVDQQRSRR